MKEKLAQIKAEAIKQIENSRTLEQLNDEYVSASLVRRVL